MIYQSTSRRLLGAPADESRREMEMAWGRILFEISSIRIYLVDWKKSFEKEGGIKGGGKVFN